MKKNKLLIALAIATCSTVVIADDKIDYSFSMKLWNSKLGWYTERANFPIFSLTAKKGDYF